MDPNANNARQRAVRRTGRSPSGNLRNFAAMGPAKYQAVYNAVLRENNDQEAMAKLAEVNRARAYLAEWKPSQPDWDWGQQPPAKPYDVGQDIWDTLLALAE
jgi:hypothetical protein